ncbi:Hvo_1808 family surface protein [Halocatena salina]|uniref:Hvo_1808 family surface protein n=1 Tax=Halocatena salina TaxID=2934340 RepID=A0A8U0A0K5_9EURY|nr:Hvo_1808 family surface protein [Halocatena salina]UPM42386.1 Hvo_1808 family surface protein [Halocatena salina]
MDDRQIALLVLTLSTVIAGCSTPFGTGDDLGQEGGYSATDELDVTTDDGLNESERESVVHRTMARIEVIRGLEFDRDVSVRVISRAEYREQRNQFGLSSTNETEWTEQVWEALFLVDESTNATEAISDVYRGSVLGYYSEEDIVIVSDSDTPRIDPYTLAHELTHALQDQQLTLNVRDETQDAQLATNGLIEGDANAVEYEYRRRCEGSWSCLPRPVQPSDRSDRNQGVYTTISMPYVKGPAFIEALSERGGWETVNDAYESLPESTEQIIHPTRYPDESPESVRIADRSAEQWQRFTASPGTETVGEASIYTMFRTNGVIPAPQNGRENYSHPMSTGWAGDRLVPYNNTDGQNGYVWKTKWDTERDAKQFVDGYERLLEQHNASAVDGTHRLPESDPYADAFRVTREGRTVTIVNAPTADELDRIH